MTLNFRVRELFFAAGHIAGLWAIAVAHPVLEVVGRAPIFFVAHRADPADILILLGTLLLAGPAALTISIAIAAMIGAGSRQLLIGTVLTLLVGLVGVQLLKHLGVSTWAVALTPSALLGIAAAVLYFRRSPVRTFFSVLMASVVVVPAVFLWQPGVGRLIVTSTQATTAADPGAAGFQPVPIVLVVFDEFPLVSLFDRHHNIDRIVYPNLSALARDGVWFRNATTVGDYTDFAVPPIVTGRYPKAGDLPTYRHHPDNVLSFLRRTHRLEVVQSGTEMTPRGPGDDPQPARTARLAGIGQDLAIVAAYAFLTADLQARLGLPDLTTRWARFGGTDHADDGPLRGRPRNWSRRSETATRFLREIRASDRQPTFYFLHTLLPHQPWVFLPSGQRNGSPAPFPTPSRLASPDDEWPLTQIHQRHLLQVGFVDRLVGRLIGRLKDAALYDRSLVIVTADHGVALTRGQSLRRFSPATAAEIMRVPLIVKPPTHIEVSGLAAHLNGDGQRVSDRNVETIDVAPTIAHVVGVRLPWMTDGQSLLDPSVAPRTEKRIWFDGAAQSHGYGPEGPPIAAVLEHRLRTIGDANVYHVPRPDRFASLVGRRVADLPVVNGSMATDVAFAWMYADIDPAADTVPFDVSGHLLDRERASSPAYVAVSVNGTVAAVTRTWPAGSGRWVATPPLDAWRRGHNAVDVFLIQEDEGQPVLARVRRQRSRPNDLNLISEAAALYWRVQQRGFSTHERAGDRFFRWTRGDASVTVPLLEQRPTAVRLGIARAIDPAIRVRIAADDCTLFEGTIPRQGWEITFPLRQCEVTGQELTIRIDSETRRSRNVGDRRLLGVAVRHLILETSDSARP